MENASKALLIAGGILMAMLTVSLLLFGWGRISDYYREEEENIETMSIAEFNNQYMGYDREDIYGYELISLTNKVADYNMRYSNVAGAQNDQKYNPISLIIEMKPIDVKNNITYGGGNSLIFTSSVYNTTTTAKGLDLIISQMNTLEQQYEKKNLQNLCKAISDIFKGSSASNSEKELAVAKFMNITTNFYAINESLPGNKKDVYRQIKADYEAKNINGAYSKIINSANGFENAAKKYYEYTQFKKAIFKSDTNFIKYDDATGRISQMKFIFTGNIE